MKNSQKGFVVPLVIIIIAVLALVGGVYIYSQSNSTKTENINADSTKQNTTTQPTTPTPPVQSENELIIQGILKTKVLLSSGDAAKIRAYFQAEYADNPKFAEQAKSSDDKAILATAALSSNALKGIDETFLKTKCVITITGNTAKCSLKTESNLTQSITAKKINGVWQ